MRYHLPGGGLRGEKQKHTHTHTHTEQVVHKTIPKAILRMSFDPPRPFSGSTFTFKTILRRYLDPMGTDCKLGCQGQVWFRRLPISQAAARTRRLVP